MIWLLMNTWWLLPALAALGAGVALALGVGVPVLRTLAQRVPALAWQALAAVLAVSLASSWLIGVGESRVQAQWDAREADYALQRAEAAIAARNTEARHRAEYAAIAARFLAEQKVADEKYQSDLASLRAGSLRLQKRFACPRLPGATGSAAGIDGAGAGGLQLADQEFLLRIGRDADELARRLNALQEAVKAGRKSP